MGLNPQLVPQPRRTPIPPAWGISLYPPPMPQPRDSHCTSSPGIPLTLSARGVPHILSPTDPSIPPAHLSLQDFLLPSSPSMAPLSSVSPFLWVPNPPHQVGNRSFICPWFGWEDLPVSLQHWQELEAARGEDAAYPISLFPSCIFNPAGIVLLLSELLLTLEQPH